jgi:hypothetical protein
MQVFMAVVEIIYLFIYVYIYLLVYIFIYSGSRDILVGITTKPQVRRSEVKLLPDRGNRFPSI